MQQPQTLRGPTPRRPARGRGTALRGAILLVLLRCAAPVAAQTAPPPPQARAPAAPLDPNPAAVGAGPGRGLTIASPERRFELTLRGRLQLRDTFVREPGKSTNEAAVKTLRARAAGRLMRPDLLFALQLAFGSSDFEGDSASPIFDAYIELPRWRDANLRVGQFLVPFDRARTMREFALQLVDRPQLVRELGLDRDVGIMASSADLFGTRIVGYQLFLGAGDGRNRVGGQGLGPLLVARLVLRPWGPFDDESEGDLLRERRPRLALGLAAAYNHQTGRRRSTSGDTFTLGRTNDWHADLDLVLKWRGLSLLAEALARRVTRDHLDREVDGQARREWTRSGYGYLTQLGLMVHPLVELTARWEQLFAWNQRTDPELQALAQREGSPLGGGVNLYLDGHALKLQGDCFFVFDTDHGSRRQVARLQLDASF